MTNIGDRARQGAQDIHAAFTHAPIPDAPVGRKSHRTLAMVGSLGLVAAVVATAFVLANRDDSREAQGTPPNVETTKAAESTSVAPAVSASPATALVPGLSHVGIGATNDWQRVAAGGPMLREEGDTDWQRKLTVIDTPSGRFIGESIPADIEGYSEGDPSIIIGSTKVTIGTSIPSRIEWLEGPYKVDLLMAAPPSEELAAKLVPMVEVDAEGYLVPVANGPATLLYRGDIAPSFAVVSSSVTEGVPFDEVTAYEGPPSSGVPAALLVGVLRGRADGLALIETLATTFGGTATPWLPGTTSRRGTVPLSIDDTIGLWSHLEYAVAAVGDDLIVVVGSGLDAAAFEKRLATIAPIDDQLWASWTAETPLDTYLTDRAELPQAATEATQGQDVPVGTEVPTTS